MSDPLENYPSPRACVEMSRPLDPATSYADFVLVSPDPGVDAPVEPVPVPSTDGAALVELGGLAAGIATFQTGLGLTPTVSGFDPAGLGLIPPPPKPPA